MEVSQSPKSPATVTIAIVEDIESVRAALAFQLATASFEVAEYASGESLLQSAEFRKYDCVVADICLPKMNGLQLLAEIKQSAPYVSVIFVTGCGDISIGVQAMRDGAIDCLEKPIDDQTLLKAIGRGADLAQKARGMRAET